MKQRPVTPELRVSKRNQILTDRLWQMKKAAQDIQNITKECKGNCVGLKCPLWKVGGGFHCCNLIKISDMYIPRHYP